MTISKDHIVAYYDQCQSDYSLFWDLERSRALHAGYWDASTRSLADALQRENEVLAEMAAIKASDKVLDAGCGVGGSACFLAEKYSCHVTGISLSQRQIQDARSYAAKKHFAITPEFIVADFTQTPFGDASFDVIWGIESICHAQDKAAFAREAYRLLKPGGRLVVADGFALRSHFEKKDSQNMRRWLYGWGVDALETVAAFHTHLAEAGFQAIRSQDITDHVRPSSRRLYWISMPALLYSKIGQWLGWRTALQTENIRAAYYQYTTLQKGLWHYTIFTAQKN